MFISSKTLNLAQTELGGSSPSDLLSKLESKKAQKKSQSVFRRLARLTSAC